MICFTITFVLYFYHHIGPKDRFIMCQISTEKRCNKHTHCSVITELFLVMLFLGDTNYCVRLPNLTQNNFLKAGCPSTHCLKFYFVDIPSSF